MTRLTFLGLGRMGRPMAENLLEIAAPLVVWNRSAEKARDFVRAHPEASSAGTPAEAAAGAELVVSMMADDAAAASVHLGAAGTFAADPAPGVVVECGTLSPGLARRLHAAAAERGVGFLDVPVSGSVDAASSATLALMAGGDEVQLVRARPVLERLGRDVTHLGPSGSGALAKLLVNGVLFALNQAVAEVLALADAGGLPRERFYDLLAASAAGAPMLGYRRAQYLDPDAPLTFTLELAAKDVSLLLAEAERFGVPAEQARVSLNALQDAVAAGHGGEDMAALAVRLRARASGEDGT
jgi:3-hydroxyisobutyrate dehydrogenase-like beta-hydroxyacid dehydrogenase